jgi:hypothetical protein
MDSFDACKVLRPEVRKVPSKSTTWLARSLGMGYRAAVLGDRLMAGQEPLELPIKVRILVPERMGHP